MTISTSLLIPLRPDVASESAEPFVIERSNEDAALEMPLLMDFDSLTFLSTGKPDGRHYTAINSIGRLGVSVFRVYAPPNRSVSVDSLLPPLVSDRIQGVFAVANPSWFYGQMFGQPSGYAGQAVVSLGRASADVTEVLQFSGSAEARLKYWYEILNLTVLGQTEFVDDKGIPMPAATHVGSGKFRTARPGYGAVHVKYTTTFSRYKVYYDHQGILLPYQISDGQVLLGDIATGLNGLLKPPLPIVVKVGQKLAVHTVDRDIFDLMAALGRGGNWPRQNPTEPEAPDPAYYEDVAQRVEQTVRVENPSDPDQYVDVKRRTSTAFVRGDGASIKLVFNNS